MSSDDRTFDSTERLILEQLENEEQCARIVDDWIMMGLDAFVSHMYPEAIDFFNAALDMDPKNASIYVQRGDVHWTSGELEEALNDYEMAIFCGAGEDVVLARDQLRSMVIQNREGEV